MAKKVSVQQVVNVAKTDHVTPVMVAMAVISVTAMQEIMSMSTMEFLHHVINCL